MSSQQANSLLPQKVSVARSKEGRYDTAARRTQFVSTEPSEFDEILKRFDKLTREERDELIEKRRQSTAANGEQANRTLLDQFNARGMVRSINDAPTDWKYPLLITVSCWCMLLASSTLAARQPNIVFIVIDDLGYGDLGCCGNTIHHTPNIDALAAGGMRFTDFHANGPVCSPTRAAMMTGQYQQRSSIESAIGFTKDEGMPLRKTTIAEMLQCHGYTCGVIGKWHLGHVNVFGPNDQGFDVSYCSNNSPDYHTHVSRGGVGLVQGSCFA